MAAPSNQPQRSSPASSTPSVLQSHQTSGIIKGGDPYGLSGLLSLIRMTDPLASALDLGIDLSSLGLDLTSTESANSFLSNS